MMRHVLLLAMALFLAGCATKYQPQSITGGYQELQLAPDLYRVSFAGNGYTDRERAAAFCLLRCAELTLRSGYRYFAILEAANNGVVSGFTTPGYAATTVVRNTAYTNFSPPQAIGFYKPRPVIVIGIRMLPNPIPRVTLDAVSLRNSIVTSYNLNL